MTEENQIVKADTPQLAMRQGGVQLTNIEQIWRFADFVVKANLAPKGMEKQEKIALVVEHGLEYGISPMKALSCSMIVNNRVAFFGDMPLALVRQSGLLNSISETIEGEGDEREAICTTLRRDGQGIVKLSRFSVADAKQAGLWGKSGPWSNYPERMLMWRARAFNLRDNFGDVLMGVCIAEEHEGVEVEYKTDETAPQTTPRDERTEDEPVTRTAVMAADELYHIFKALWGDGNRNGPDALCGLLVLANGGKVGDYEDPAVWTIGQCDAARDLIRGGNIPSEIIALYPRESEPEPEPESTEDIDEDLEAAAEAKRDLFDGEKETK